MTLDSSLITQPKRTLAALAFAAALCGTSARAEGGDTVYRDAAWRFQMTIAPGWTAEPLAKTSFPAVLIVRGPEALDRREMCVVHVDEDSRTVRTPQADLDRQVRNGKFGPGSYLIMRPETFRPDMKMLHDEVIDFHGSAARFIEASVTSPGRGQEQIYVVLFQAPGRAIRGLCQAGEAHYTQYRPVFERMLRSMTVFD